VSGPDPWVAANLNAGLTYCDVPLCGTPAACPLYLNFTFAPGPTAVLTYSPLLWQLYVGGARVTINTLTLDGVSILSAAPLVFTDLAYSLQLFNSTRAPTTAALVYTIDLTQLDYTACSSLLLPVFYPPYIYIAPSNDQPWVTIISNSVCILLVLVVTSGFLYIAHRPHLRLT
jgi:hypothetical protein